MVTAGLSVTLQAKPAKAEEVASFLEQALPLVQRETLMERPTDLLAEAPTIEYLDVLADKLPV